MIHATNANNENKLVVSRVLHFIHFLAGLVFLRSIVCYSELCICSSKRTQLLLWWTWMFLVVCKKKKLWTKNKDSRQITFVPAFILFKLFRFQRHLLNEINAWGETVNSLHEDLDSVETTTSIQGRRYITVVASRYSPVPIVDMYLATVSRSVRTTCNDYAPTSRKRYLFRVRINYRRSDELHKISIINFKRLS